MESLRSAGATCYAMGVGRIGFRVWGFVGLGCRRKARLLLSEAQVFGGERAKLRTPPGGLGFRVFWFRVSGLGLRETYPESGLSGHCIALYHGHCFSLYHERTDASNTGALKARTSLWAHHSIVLIRSVRE